MSSYLAFHLVFLGLLKLILVWLLGCSDSLKKRNAILDFKCLGVFGFLIDVYKRLFRIPLLHLVDLSLVLLLRGIYVEEVKMQALLRFSTSYIFFICPSTMFYCFIVHQCSCIQLKLICIQLIVVAIFKNRTFCCVNF